jgi:hypothetical protein
MIANLLGPSYEYQRAEALNRRYRVSGSDSSVDIRLIKEHLLDIGAGTLGTCINEVRSEVYNRGAGDTHDVVAEPIKHSGGGRIWASSVVVEKYKGKVVPVLSPASGVSSSCFGQQETAETRHIDFYSVQILTDLRTEFAHF